LLDVRRVAICLDLPSQQMNRTQAARRSASLPFLCVMLFSCSTTQTSRSDYDLMSDAGFFNPSQPGDDPFVPPNSPIRVDDNGVAKCIEAGLDGGVELLEFSLPMCEPDASTPVMPSCDPDRSDCEDASVPPAMPDAGQPDVPEPSSCWNIPVRYQVPTCAEPFWDRSTVGCAIEDGELRVSGSLCESCGEDRSDLYLNELYLVFSDCEGCVISVAAWQLRSGNNSFAANECKASELLRKDIGRSIDTLIDAPNRGPAVGQPLDCVQLHVLTHFSEAPDCDVACQLESRTMPAGGALPGALACECDLTLGTCAQ